MASGFSKGSVVLLCKYAGQEVTKRPGSWAEPSFSGSHQVFFFKMVKTYPNIVENWNLDSTLGLMCFVWPQESVCPVLRFSCHKSKQVNFFWKIHDKDQDHCTAFIPRTSTASTARSLGVKQYVTGMRTGGSSAIKHLLGRPSYIHANCTLLARLGRTCLEEKKWGNFSKWLPQYQNTKDPKQGKKLQNEVGPILQEIWHDKLSSQTSKLMLMSTWWQCKIQICICWGVQIPQQHQ